MHLADALSKVKMFYQYVCSLGIEPTTCGYNIDVCVCVCVCVCACCARVRVACAVRLI